MSRFAVVLVLSLALATFALVAEDEPSGPLDGKTFDVIVIDQSTGEETADTLIFANGTFDSVECRKYGFGKTPYEAKKEPESEIWTFTADALSPEEGTITWIGSVTGLMVEGTMEWAKSGQDPIHYEFSSVIKTKQ